MKSKRSLFGAIGATLVVVLVVVAILAPVISPYDPKAITGDSLEPPSGRHLVGTNDIGQDNFSQLVWGSRRSLGIGIASSAFVMLTGVCLGIGATLIGGLTEKVVLRIIDLFLAMPILPLLTVIAILAGPSSGVMVLTFGLIGWPMLTRIIRSETLKLRRRGYVKAAQGFGGGIWYVLRRHIASALGPIISTTLATMAGVVMVIEASLAFLGLSDPTAVSWGAMLNRALSKQGIFFSNVWMWEVLPAGLAITAAVLGFTFLAVGIDPKFNPRVRRSY